MFGRAAISLGIGPHSSLSFLFSFFCLFATDFIIPVNKDYHNPSQGLFKVTGSQVH